MSVFLQLLASELFGLLPTISATAVTDGVKIHGLLAAANL